jgi:hypothetical protein
MPIHKRTTYQPGLFGRLFGKQYSESVWQSEGSDILDNANPPVQPSGNSMLENLKAYIRETPHEQMTLYERVICSSFRVTGGSKHNSEAAINVAAGMLYSAHQRQQAEAGHTNHTNHKSWSDRMDEQMDSCRDVDGTPILGNWCF